MATTKEHIWTGRKIIPLWLVLILLTMCGLALLGDRGALRAVQSLDREQELKLQLADLKVQQEQLRSEIHRLREDRNYWEQLERKDLGMVREGELIYQLDDSDAAR